MKAKIKCAVFFVVIALNATIQLHAVENINWTWAVERAALYDSVLSISDKSVTKFEFECDLGDAIKDIQGEDSSAKIDVVSTRKHPTGLLIVSCNVGAHSEQITIIDPSKSEIVFQKTGSYYAAWEQTDGQLIISYDQPCDGEQERNCENRFVAIEEKWP